MPSHGEGAKAVVLSVEEPDLMKLTVKVTEIECNGDTHNGTVTMQELLDGIEKEKHSAPKACKK